MAEGARLDMRLPLWLCLMAVSAIMTSPVWSEQQAARVALVIGNAHYPDASTPLSTTIKDARTLAEEFHRTGFAVDLKENVGKADMKSAMDAFTGGVRPGMTALFYFSGYGIQVARQTYLIPINAQLWTEGDVRQDGISLDDVVADIHRKGAKVKLVIIDAARRDPYERRFRAVAAGLAPIDAPENTLAIFSAAPGKLVNDGTGTSSLFIGELVKQLRAPKVAAEEIFNRVRVGVARASNNAQIPWIFSSLLEPFYFGSPPTLVTTDHATSLCRRRPHRASRPMSPNTAPTTVPATLSASKRPSQRSQRTALRRRPLRPKPCRRRAGSAARNHVPESPCRRPSSIISPSRTSKARTNSNISASTRTIRTTG
jgi:hypothetical protein